MVFPVVMYGLWQLDFKEIWAQKNWCFWTVVLEKTLESPLACKEIQSVNSKGSQYWIFIGRTDVSWNSNTLATWCEKLTHLKRLMLGKIEGRRRRGRQRMRWLEGSTDSMDISLSTGSWWWTGNPSVLQSMGSQRVGLSNWTKTTLRLA